MNNKTASVGIISYNHLPYLSTTIESVLNQTYQNVEIIIVDDGSKDGSLELAESYAGNHSNIKVFTHKNHANKGISATCNLAIEKSQGEYISILGSDDAFYPHTVKDQVDFLEVNPLYGMVCGICQYIDKNGNKLPQTFGENIWSNKDYLRSMLMGNRISAPTVMVRRACYNEIGLYNTNLIYSDYEMWLRIMIFSDWKIGFINKILAKYRVHDANVSVNQHYMITRSRTLDVLWHLDRMLDKSGEKHLLTGKWLRQGIANSKLAVFYEKAEEGRILEAFNYASKSITIDPSQLLNVRRLASICYRMYRGFIKRLSPGSKTIC